MVFLNASTALPTLRILARCWGGTYVRPERDGNRTAILGPDMYMLRDMQDKLPKLEIVYNVESGTLFSEMLARLAFYRRRRHRSTIDFFAASKTKSYILLARTHGGYSHSCWTHTHAYQPHSAQTFSTLSEMRWTSTRPRCGPLSPLRSTSSPSPPMTIMST